MGPLENASCWLVTVAKNPARNPGSLRYCPWVFLGWLERKYNTWIMTTAPDFHFSTLFSCVGIHGQLQDPRTLLGGWQGMAKSRGQHQRGLKRGCRAHAAPLGSLATLHCGNPLGSSLSPVWQAPAWWGRMKHLEGPRALFMGSSFWFDTLSCPVFSEVGVAGHS